MFNGKIHYHYFYGHFQGSYHMKPMVSMASILIHFVHRSSMAKVVPSSPRPQRFPFSVLLSWDRISGSTGEKHPKIQNHSNPGGFLLLEAAGSKRLRYHFQVAQKKTISVGPCRQRRASEKITDEAEEEGCKRSWVQFPEEPFVMWHWSRTEDEEEEDDDDDDEHEHEEEKDEKESKE